MSIARIPLLLALTAGLFLGGCGGGDSDPGTGVVQVSMTDAPVDEAEAVVIHFTDVTLHGPNGNTLIEIYDPANPNPTEKGRSIDLMQFQHGMWTGLFDDVVVAGNYSWMRLKLDLSKSYIQIGGNQFPLRCTSCENSDFRLNRSFSIPKDGTLALMLDFDLRKSITDPNNQTSDYILRPTLRVIETAVSGAIAGDIDPNLIADLGGFTGCSVYAFTDFNAQLDDVYIPMNNQIPATQNNPVSTAKVVYENNAYHYMLAFLPEGEYTVALTCAADTDHADSDDELVFADPIYVAVTAGQTSDGDMVKILPPPPAP